MLGRPLLFFFSLLGLIASESASAKPTELQKRMAYWQIQALMCDAGLQGVKFPSKQSDEIGKPCDDGDMTLFNGLLCASGDQRGCTGVAEAQDPTTGQWHRSPRIRLNGNDRGGAQFSPDMALGVQLYLVATGDVVRGWKWLLWLDEHVPCAIEHNGTCYAKGLIPRFCTDDNDGRGCTMRPGDAAQLANTVSWLQKNKGMADLPDGRLRGYLGTFSGNATTLSWLSSQLNRPGYSQHLVGVEVMLLRLTGSTDAKLGDAASTLQKANPGNAFYSYLVEGPSARVVKEVLARCPQVGSPSQSPRYQWQWERENADRAWEHSAYWDCIFLGNLIGSN